METGGYPLPNVDLKLPHTAVQPRLASTVRCRRCGRPLRRPESRWNQIGGWCAAGPERALTYTIPQDTLPGT